MVLEVFLDTVAEYLREYLKHSSLSPEDRVIIAGLSFLILPLLAGALGTDSKWRRFFFLAVSSVIALTPVLYMKIYGKHEPLLVFLSYSIAVLLLLIALIDVFCDLILFVLLKLVDLVFFVLEKVLGRFLRNRDNE